MKLKEYILSDCCKSITDGDHQAPPKSTTGIPFITISNIHNNQIDFSDTMYVPKEYYKNLDNTKVARPGDILYSVVGSFGIPVLIQDDRNFVFQRHIAILKPNADVVDARYLYYIMLSREFYKQADSVALGAAQRTISLSALRNMRIKLPSIKEQKLISDVLSVYDELIENNQKQIKLLEEAAQRLYKEWFVDLHFPGYEDVKIVDGVPEGWKRRKLIDIADIQYGYAFDGSLFSNDKKGMPIIRIRNIPNGITSDFTTENADSQYIVHSGDIVVGMDGEFHINSWSGPDAYLVQRTCSIRPHNDSIKGYILQAIYRPIKYFEKTLVGSTVSHLGKKHIDSIFIMTAPEKFYKPFESFFEERQKLLIQNIILSEARDRLLPKLMSGEIEV